MGHKAKLIVLDDGCMREEDAVIVDRQDAIKICEYLGWELIDVVE